MKKIDDIQIKNSLWNIIKMKFVDIYDAKKFKFIMFLVILFLMNIYFFSLPDSILYLKDEFLSISPETHSKLIIIMRILAFSIFSILSSFVEFCIIVFIVDPVRQFIISTVKSYLGMRFLPLTSEEVECLNLKCIEDYINYVNNLVMGKSKSFFYFIEPQNRTCKLPKQIADEVVEFANEYYKPMFNTIQKMTIQSYPPKFKYISSYDGCTYAENSHKFVIKKITINRTEKEWITFSKTKIKACEEHKKKKVNEYEVEMFDLTKKYKGEIFNPNNIERENNNEHKK